ncbi:MAG TPA: hypothetical protein PLI51_11120, partial [bacterium]|nr:hypothetical protein [bacterium]
MSEQTPDRVGIQRLLELTWKPAKILRLTGVLLVAYLIRLVFGWIAPASAGAAWFAQIIMFVGDIVIYFLVLWGMTAVAARTLEEINGTPPRGAAGGQIFLSPIKIFAVIAALVAVHAVIDLLGSIPWVGELAWMFSPALTFPLAVAIIAAILVLAFGIMLLPTIIAVGQEGPVSELVDFLRRHTIRFLGHFLIAAAVSAITVGLLFWALGYSAAISGVVMGNKFYYIQTNVPDWTRGLNIACPFLMPRIWPPSPDPVTGRWTLVLAGFVYGVIVWLIKLGIFGSVLVTFSVAGTLSYLGLKPPREEREPEQPAGVDAEPLPPP